MTYIALLLRILRYEQNNKTSTTENRNLRQHLESLLKQAFAVVPVHSRALSAKTGILYLLLLLMICQIAITLPASAY